MHARVGRTRASQRGFTMVEILVAMTLAAIAIIGIMVLYMAQTRAGGFSRHSTEASVLAQDRLEDLRTQPAATMTNVTESTLNERGQTVAGGIFTRITNEALGTSAATLKVQVTWNDDGFAHQVTVYAQRDLP